VTNQRERTSGVFRAITEGARRFTRAVTGGGDTEPPPEARALGDEIAQAFIAGRFGDVHALGTPNLQSRTDLARFDAQWRYATTERGPLTGFEVSDAGTIDLGFIPGLEDTPQEEFLAFLEIAFSSPSVPLEHEKAFVVSAVILAHEGRPRLGALHSR
jgi:hypothetical protein